MTDVQEVDDVTMAFPGNVDHLLPPWDEIPDEFKHHPGTSWNKVVSIWFFRGLKNAKWKPKPGIDIQKALRHVSACMGSFAPQHEHKEAGCAYLLSQWFDDVEYEPAKELP